MNSGFYVIHVFPHSAELSGGHTNSILNFMDGQIRHGLEVRGICPIGKDIPEGIRVPVKHLPIREMDFDAPDFPQAAIESVAGAPRTLFHFHGFTPRYLRLGKALNKTGIPYVVTSQGQLHYRGLVHWAKKFAYLNFVIPFFRKASGLHFVTRREHSRSKFLFPFCAKPVLVQQNVVNLPDPAAISAAAREEYDLPRDSLIFGYVGRLHIEHKGLDLLIKGFAQLLGNGFGDGKQDGGQRASSPYLVLIGPDWEGDRARLEKLAQDLTCSSQVRFLGPKQGEAKWKLLKMTDAFISPSRWDACPSAVTEAVGFGVPTIVSSTMNPAPELAEAGAAVSADPTPESLADAMHSFAADPALRTRFATRGREWVLANCSLSVAGEKFENFYSEVLNHHLPK